MKDEQEPHRKVRGRSGSLMKKFKFRGRRGSSTEAHEDVQVEGGVQEKAYDGEDVGFSAGRSASETNLTEVSWKSAQNVEKEASGSSVRSVISAESSQLSASTLPERTKSLENLKSMPAYGELILDPSDVMVIRANICDNAL